MAQQQPQKRGYFPQIPRLQQFHAPQLNVHLPNPIQQFQLHRAQRNKPLPDISRAFGASAKDIGNIGVEIATKYPTGYALKLRKAASIIRSQPFSLSGRRSPSPLKPAEKFMQKAHQISHQPFAISGSTTGAKGQPGKRGGGGGGRSIFGGGRGGGGGREDESKFVQKAHQIANQPFKLLIHPPSPTHTSGDIFRKRANQLAHQPFKMGGKPAGQKVSQADLALFKKKAKSIGFLATTTLFHKVIEEEKEKHGHGLFKSTAKAVMRTQRMFRNIKYYDPTRGSNEVEIKKGIYPMLRRDVLEVLFQYMPVSELKTARLVCDFWKRFATIVIQQKSIVRLSGICKICNSEYTLDDPDIPEHDHSETISFYRFLLFIQDVPQDKHYHLPFRSFKISKLNLYFIPGLNTFPTRVFLMFLKLWAEKVHELRLKAVQLSPPDALYRILDTCSRMRKVTFDDVRVWLDPLAPKDVEPPVFRMKLNYYLQSITFCTNWIGEELLHWQMMLEAYPCLEEINMIDVAKPEINHLLTALLNLPDEEEIEEVKKTGGFKKMSRRLMFLKVGGKDAESEEERLRMPSPRLILNMPFSVDRVYRLLKVDQEEEGASAFKKMAKNVSIRGVSPEPQLIPSAVTPRSFRGKTKQIMLSSALGRSSAPIETPDIPVPEEPSISAGIKMKKFAKKVGKVGSLPFKLSSLTPEAEEEIKKEGGEAFKKFAVKISKQPFKMGRPSSSVGGAEGEGGEVKAEGTGEGAAEGTDEAVKTAEGETKVEGEPGVPRPAGTGMSTKFRSKAKSYMNQPFKMLPPKPAVEEKKKDKKLKKKVRGIINQPFMIIKPDEPDKEPVKFVPKTFKSQINKILHQPFKVKKPSILLKFKTAAKTLTLQPFHLSAPKAHEKVHAGSRLRKINIGTRRNFEDQLKEEIAADDTDTGSDTGDERLKADEFGYHSATDSGSDSDESSTDSIQERDLTILDVHELLAEVVVKFDITHLTLRAHYTSEDAAKFPVVLEACREKVRYLTLTRPSKVYVSELNLQYRSCPFETPEETKLEFPYVRCLSIAHNFVDSIDEISASFPALTKLIVNIVPTEFLVPKKTPYKSYVKTNLMITMGGGKPMPNVKILEWNIHEARHPYTQKRTVVYKSNALRYAPRIFPNLSKLVVSITTAHELHVIFRQCTQLHDLVVLKNSFYRTKDADIIGDPERPEWEQELYEFEEDEAAREANRAREVHPTRLKNGGIKQLIYLRRLALLNNNCCLTNESIEEGFIHLRRLRSLHISMAKRISLRAIRQLKKCRFLVNVRISKDKLKNKPPPPPPPDDDDENPDNKPPPPLPPGYPPFCVPANNVPTHPKLGFEGGTKFDKIGGKRYVIVKTAYEVNGRRYELIRKQYECKEDRDSQIWEKRYRLAERRRQMQEERQKEKEKLKEAEIDGLKIVRKAEKRLRKFEQDQESDYERFMIDYDDDVDEDEEGYVEEDDDVLMSELQFPEDEDAVESSDEDGICPEADSMYEGDKENYIDTEPKSSTGDESYCESPSDPEYHADKDTGDETEGKKKDENEEKQGEQAQKPAEQSGQREGQADGTTQQRQVQPQAADPSADETTKRQEQLVDGPTPEPTPTPEGATPTVTPQPVERPMSGPSRVDKILEKLKFSKEKAKARRKEKRKKKSGKIHPFGSEPQLHLRATRKTHPSESSTTCTSGPFRHIYSAGPYHTSTSDGSVSIQASRRPSTSSFASSYVPMTRSASVSSGRVGHRHSISTETYQQSSSEANLHVRNAFSASTSSRSTNYALSSSVTRPTTTETLTNEPVGIEYREAMRRLSVMSCSSQGPGPSFVRRGSHLSYPASSNSTDRESSGRSQEKEKKQKKDKKRSDGKKEKKDKKTRSKSVEPKRKKKKEGLNDEELKRAGSVSPSQMQLLGDLRKQLIEKMVKDVRKEIKKK